MVMSLVYALEILLKSSKLAIRVLLVGPF